MAFFCDSMWGVSNKYNYLLTIVVINHDYTIHLAAMALAPKEDEQSWKAFFNYVKECVPTFHPNTLMSDGACYISSAIAKTVNAEAFHITCWWHQQQNMKKKNGKELKISRIIQAMVYARTYQQLQEQYDRIVKEIKESKTDKRIRKKLMKKLQSMKERAFINLPVFTGGTPGNFFAESINNRLRIIGCSIKHTRIEVILALREHCRYPILSVRPFKMSKELIGIMSKDVIHHVSCGVLKLQEKLIHKSNSFCKLDSCDGNKFFVTETVVTTVNNGVKLATEEVWTVTHDEEANNFHCSCNSLVHSGVPCMHIITVALQNHFQISL